MKVASWKIYTGRDKQATFFYECSGFVYYVLGWVFEIQRIKYYTNNTAT